MKETFNSPNGCFTTPPLNEMEFGAMALVHRIKNHYTESPDVASWTYDKYKMIRERLGKSDSNTPAVCLKDMMHKVINFYRSRVEEDAFTGENEGIDHSHHEGARCRVCDSDECILYLSNLELYEDEIRGRE